VQCAYYVSFFYFLEIFFLWFVPLVLDLFLCLLHAIRKIKIQLEYELNPIFLHENLPIILPILLNTCVYQNWNKYICLFIFILWSFIFFHNFILKNPLCAFTKKLIKLLGRGFSFMLTRKKKNINPNISLLCRKKLALHMNMIFYKILTLGRGKNMLK
jgi:hypothetical protein